MIYPSKHTIILILSAIVLIVLSNVISFRIDLTSDRRHSISKPAKELMKTVDKPIRATIYLTGDLNPGFLRLKNSTIGMLEELNAFGKSDISIRFVNPSGSDSDTEYEQDQMKPELRGMTGTAVYDKDKEGNVLRKIVYPWVELTYQNKTIPVNLLKNDITLSGEENLNISIENLEFELTDAIRRLMTTGVSKIAFLEGHGELNEIETYDISKSLNRYFQIDRGAIDTDAGVLNEYKAVIIAKPTEPFSEKDKFVLDQYLMNGGTILWLIDGIKISEESLTTEGISPITANDLNLNDMLFRYGVRINPVLVEDTQSALIPVNIAPKGEKAEFRPMPWVFSPLLLTSSEHAATKNLPPVKARFASITEPTGNNNEISKTVILATSSHTHLRQTPDYVSVAHLPDLKDNHYFNHSFVPVGIALEGTFQSVFANRIPPPGIQPAPRVIKLSKKTRQVIIADGDIIRNEVQQNGDTIEALPLGFDRYTQQQFGNSELIVNTVRFLTDKEGWMTLRAKTIPLRLLNKTAITTQRTKWQIINTAIPLTVLFVFGILYRQIRKRKHTQ